MSNLHRELAERHRCGQPDKPIARPVSSLPILARRVREVGRAFNARDETAARAELRALGQEALTLSKQDPLWP